MNFKDWFNKNKVLILGLILSAAMPVNDLLQTGETSLKTIVMASATAVLSFVGRNFRGQWPSIAGILQAALGNIFTPNISWYQIITQLIVAFLALQIPAAKSIGYEQTPLIKEAKNEGEESIPTLAKPTPDKV